VWGATLVGLSLHGCAPVAQSILKGARLAAPAPQQEEVASQAAGPRENSAGTETPSPIAKEIQSPLVIPYFTEIVDALETSDWVTRIGPSPSPDGTGDTLTVSLSEIELSQFQETGSIEFQISALPTGTAIANITGRFHVIQQELELIEEDEGFETELSVFALEGGMKGVLRTQEPIATHFETASTLSRLVWIDLVFELQTLGPLLSTALSH
jgi:hypothetical protein